MTEYRPRLFTSDAEIEHLGEGFLARALPKGEWTHEAHLATTTVYSGTYVDPYLIARNGREADWLNTVQTFGVPDDLPITVRDDVLPAEPSTRATSGSIWSVTASAARGIWHGFNYSREAIASYIADQAIAFNQGGIEGTVIGHA